MRQRTDKSDVEGHLAINEFYFAYTTCPHEAKILNITAVNELNGGTAARGFVSYRLFLLIAGIIIFAEGYMLGDVGLQWLLPVLGLTAWAAVIVGRRWITRLKKNKIVLWKQRRSEFLSISAF